MATEGPYAEPREFKIFNASSGCDYSFVMSHTWLGGHSVKEKLVNGNWQLTQEVAGRTYEAEHESHHAAVLLLIALRLGFRGELREVEE